MSRTYDLELSCGCLIGTEDDIYMPCMSDDCKADEEYFKKDELREIVAEKIEKIKNGKKK